ncbi:MAG: hypothetical protein KDD66_00260 [Bdellovibrionales bacterium]|nr:hypothetical protein [Bdellovibrionales bacterium]
MDVEKDGTEEHSPQSLTDLSATVGAFEIRFQKKKVEKEAAQNIAEQAAQLRQQALLKALMSIRKSLAKVARIDLGDRFKFDMDVDDWQGWPRITINLRERFSQKSDYPFFQVMAHDRKGQAIIELIYCTIEQRERLSITDESDLLKMPAILKKCVRTFLDTVEAQILTAQQADHDGEIENKSLDDFADTTRTPGDSALEGADDLFVDDHLKEDFFGQLPKVTDTGRLPTVNGPGVADDDFFLKEE